MDSMDVRADGAAVTVVRSFGIFLTHPLGKLFVHLPEASWVFPYDFPTHFTPGQIVDVMVIGEHGNGGELHASIRRLNPDEDLRSTIRAGDLINGRVLRKGNHGTTVGVGQAGELDFGLNSAEEWLIASAQEGAEVRLVVDKFTPLGHAFLSVARS